MLYYLILFVNLFAQEGAGGCAPAQSGGKGGGLLGGFGGFLPIILIFVIFYFLLIRPQSKQRKEVEQMRKSLSRNDKIVTNGGIVGTIISIKGDTVTIRSRDVKLDIQRSAIASKWSEVNAKPIK